MIDLEEFYKQEALLEEERCKNPCCENCYEFYREYGYLNCRIHGEVLEDPEKDACDDWK